MEIIETFEHKHYAKLNNENWKRKNNQDRKKEQEKYQYYEQLDTQRNRIIIQRNNHDVCVDNTQQ